MDYLKSPLEQFQRSPRILIVDDIEANTELISAKLKKIGYQVVVCNSGAHALKKLKSSKFDLVLLDIVMPEMDGYEVCRQINANPETRSIPVIFVTVKSEKSSLIEGFNAGAVDYLFKPYDDDELLVRINTHLTIRNSVEEMKKAKEEADQANQLKSAFLSNMSHEIRTPLNAILGFSELLLSEEVTEEEKSEYTGHIHNNGEMLLRLIDDIITLSKIEANHLIIENKDISILSLFSELSDIAKTLLKKHTKENIELKLIFPQGHEILMIQADPIRTKQVMINLIENAVKFTHSGEIVIGYHIPDENLNEIELFVQDTGIGIPLDKQEIVFNRFTQADLTTTRKYGGTGLGLSICKSLLESMNGSITINSEEGLGTEMRCRLPIQDMGQKVLKISPKLASKPQWDGKTFLLCDDVESVCEFFKSVFKHTGAKLIIAKTGEKAMQEFTKYQKDIDLVLMDLHLPGISGFDVTQSIKKTRDDIPVLVQTALSEKVNIEQAFNVGADDVILKPITKDELFKKINKLLPRYNRSSSQ